MLLGLFWLAVAVVLFLCFLSALGVVMMVDWLAAWINRRFDALFGELW